MVVVIYVRKILLHFALHFGEKSDTQAERLPDPRPQYHNRRKEDRQRARFFDPLIRKQERRVSLSTYKEQERIMTHHARAESIEAGYLSHSQFKHCLQSVSVPMKMLTGVKVARVNSVSINC